MTKKVASFYKKFISGEEVYIKGSRIPLTFVFDYFINGYTITDFLSSYPWVKKKNLVKGLEEVKKKAASSYAN